MAGQLVSRPVPEPFHWIDGERTISFGRGKLADAPFLLGGDGYTLLTTPRAAEAVEAVVDRAGPIHEVPPGRVDDIAAELRERVNRSDAPELIVALGGGRVIDVAKALAAADPPRRVAAIPTTLSGAEMTAVHRHVAGLPLDTPRVRPAIVLNDPALCGSQPLRQLAESACNALGHAYEGPLTPLRSPVATQTGWGAVTEIRLAFDSEAVTDAGASGEAEDEARDRLALGALLAGYVIGSTGYGLHHVLAQTLVRFAFVGHGQANAIMLPHSTAALRTRFPAEIAALEDAIGERPEALAARLCALTGATRLRDVVPGGSEATLETCADHAAARPDLAMTPPAATREELIELYRAAW
jgi:alcohol dehydrogenase class IV